VPDADTLCVTRPLLRRSLVVVAATALFAATASGSALAWSGTVRQVALVAPVPEADAFAAPAAVTQRHVAPVVASAGAPAAQAPAAPVRAASSAPTARKVEPASVTSAKPRAATTSGGPRTISISHYVDSPGSQAQIDKCHLVLWTHSPLWLAGHNWCGFQWLAFVPTGTTVVVRGGAAAGRYVVTGHVTLHRQSGSLPSLSADLVLQTCVGSSTGLTLLHRA
jgi:hypothetical protein